ncbi:MAG: DUF5320 domain-containing protein [Nitrososphaerota archaeon]|nr:DUF5320 domain-containing protein [Candidatus Bathyarchaeota archaeon]MDW8023478.1 DUF5320 domain-containing protein [Nitrososphaerota archaeon]
MNKEVKEQLDTLRKEIDAIKKRLNILEKKVEEALELASML